MIPLHEVPRIDKFIGTESHIEVTRVYREAENLLFNGYRVSIWEYKRVLEIASGDGFTTL